MSQQRVPITISSPGEFVATVPFVLGFVPEHSLVIVGLGEHDLECTFRVDLPDQAENAWLVPDLTTHLSRNNCGQCVIVVYGPEPIAEAVAAVTSLRLHTAGIGVFDALRVDDGLYWSLTCKGPCCPPQGRAIPSLPEAVLAMVTEGSVARSDRAAVVALLDPADAKARAAVAAALAPARESYTQHDQAARRNELEYLDQWFESPGLPWPAAIARLGVALIDRELRDQVLGTIAAHPGKARLDLWIWLVRHLDGDLVAGAATVAGWAAYRTSNGVLALEAFERALAADPANDRARALYQALQAGIPPYQAAALVGIEPVTGETAESE